MRTLEFGGKEYEIRGLRRKEIKNFPREYNFRTNGFMIPRNEEGTIDMDVAELAQNAAIEAVLTQEQIDEIDDAEGNSAFNDIFIAITAETYGSRGEEKNSSTPGGEPQTESE